MNKGLKEPSDHERHPFLDIAPLVEGEEVLKAFLKKHGVVYGGQAGHWVVQSSLRGSMGIRLGTFHDYPTMLRYCLNRAEEHIGDISGVVAQPEQPSVE